MSRSLLVKVTCGADAPERSNQGLTVAATAAAAGVPVSLWLAGEAAWLGVAGRPSYDLEHAVSPAELIATVLAGGTVTVCGQCAKRRDIGDADLVSGARIAGAAQFVEESLGDGVQALVY
jgi:predicted peroxiredoxin